MKRKRHIVRLTPQEVAYAKRLHRQFWPLERVLQLIMAAPHPAASWQVPARRNRQRRVGALTLRSLHAIKSEAVWIWRQPCGT